MNKESNNINGENLKDVIHIHDNSGRWLTRHHIQGYEEIVGIGFTKDENLLAIFENGKITKINPYSQKKLNLSISFSEDEFKRDPIIAAKVADYGIVFVTSSLEFYYVANIDDRKRVKLLSKQPKLSDTRELFDEYDCKNFQVIPPSYNPFNKKVCVFIPGNDGLYQVLQSSTEFKKKLFNEKVCFVALSCLHMCCLYFAVQTMAFLCLLK